MVLDDIITSTKQSFAERLASPLLGSFVAAWCVWNWKFLVILFSAATVSQTFALIEKYVYPDSMAIMTRGVLYPLITAAAYIFIYPYPARFIYAFTLRRQREINETKQRIADETPLTLEESRRIRAEYIEHERKNNEQIQRLNEEVARLNAALDSGTKPEAKPELSAADKLYDRLEPTEVFILRALEEIGSPALESELIKTSPEPKIKTEFAIGELERRKLLHRNFDQDRRGYTLQFTHDGRRALLENRSPDA